MTARGVGWIFLVLIFWLALAYSGMEQLQLIWAMLLVLPLVSLGQLLYLYRRIQLQQQLEHTVIRRGETTALQVRILLRSRQMIGLAELVLEKTARDDHLQEEERLTALLPASETTVTVRLQGHHRGTCRVGLKRLRCRDLFGLFKMGIYTCPRHRLTLNLTVLPRPYAFTRLQELSDLLLEKQKMRAWKPGSDLDAIANIRQQIPGDALKRAHWKLTARLDEVMIREFENPLQQEVMILCDMARWPAADLSWRQYGDFFADSTAHLAQVVLQTGCAVRLIAWQQDGRSETKADRPAQEMNVQLFLAQLTESDRWQTDQLIEGEMTRDPDSRVLLLVTNRLPVTTIRQLTQVALNGCVIWLILLQGSTALPDETHQALQPLHQAGVTICRATFTDYQAAGQHVDLEKQREQGVAR